MYIHELKINTSFTIDIIYNAKVLIFSIRR